jgi:hypothetical protein
VQAQFLIVELQKIEAVPSGKTIVRFRELIGSQPALLWKATEGEYELLTVVRATTFFFLRETGILLNSAPDSDTLSSATFPFRYLYLKDYRSRST